MISCKRSSITLGLLVIVSLIVTGCALATPTPPAKEVTVEGNLITSIIELDSGKIRGQSADGHHYYLGIPVAAPPVGDLRWKPPKPVVAWSGIRESTEYGSACPQEPYPGMQVANMDEGCLYLNVWTSATSPGDRLPVMVWIHGGGYHSGSASEALYNGSSLAKKGVVVVTVNYRVGAFGFLAHPQLASESPNGSSGHYGILDNIAALEWVQRNVAAFGGDPSRVSIFGESAGGWSVMALMQSPPAEGLFHRGIAQSPPVVSISTLYAGPPDPEALLGSFESKGQALASILGCNQATDVLACMRDKTPEEILAAVAGPQPLHFAPVGDGIVVSEALWSARDERHWQDVPLIIGTTANELTAMGIMPSVMIPEMVAGFWQMFQPWESYVQRIFGEQAERVLTLYPADTPEEVYSALDRLGTDLMTCYCKLSAALLSEQVSSPTYMYQFARVPDWEHSETMGAFHTLEIGYVFGGPRMWMQHIEYEAEDKALSETMMDYWTTFAATGDPNGPGRPDWPVYDPASEDYLEFDVEVTVKSEMVNEICDLMP